MTTATSRCSHDASVRQGSGPDDDWQSVEHALSEFVERRCEEKTSLYTTPGSRHAPFVLDALIFDDDRPTSSVTPPMPTARTMAELPDSDANSGTDSEISPPAQGQHTPLAVRRRQRGGNEPISKFHSKEVPPVSLSAIAHALRHVGQCSPAALIVGYLLMARYEARNLLPVTAHMMHRLYVACVLVGAKAHCDRYVTNSRMAAASGLALWELNQLEVAVLHALDWRVVVSASAFRAATEDPTSIFEPDLHSEDIASSSPLLEVVRSPHAGPTPSRSPSNANTAYQMVQSCGAANGSFNTTGSCSTSIPYGLTSLSTMDPPPVDVVSAGLDTNVDDDEDNNVGGVVAEPRLPRTPADLEASLHSDSDSPSTLDAGVEPIRFPASPETQTP
jgi:hypothetical protein